MTTANSTGKAFESKCIALLQEHRDFVNTKARVHWSDVNFYRPDAVTDTELFEFKYQQVTGSARNKLTQAILELQWMAERTQQDAILVYEGDELVSFVNNDPAFQLARQQTHFVNVFTFNEFYDYLTSSSNITDRQQDGLLEHTTTCG